MKTPAQIKGHPLHPLLIALPIGFWVFSIIGDIAFRLGGALTWNAAANYAVGAGIVAALIAAVPGFIDWLSIRDRRAKRIGAFHMASNLTAVVLFAISLGTRLNAVPGTTLPFVLSLCGLAVLCVGGWLGGTLVYRYRIAVQEEVARTVESSRTSERVLEPSGRMR